MTTTTVSVGGASAGRADVTSRRARPGLSRRRRETRAAALFLAPDLIGLAVFVGVPMVLSVILSFMSISGFGSYRWVGLANYQRMVADPLFWHSAWVTVLYIVVGVPLLFVVSLALGLLIQQKLPGVGAMRTMFFLPYVLSSVVVGLVWRFMLDDQTGVVNSGLRSVGLPGESWLGSPGLALGTVIAIGTWVAMGYYMVIFLSGLQDIPREYYEAARVDGAGSVASFRLITWPLLRPTSFFVLLMSTVAAITGGFDTIFVLTSGGPANGTTVLVFYIYQQAFQYGEFGYSAAMGTVLVVVMLLASLVVFRATHGGRFSDDHD